MSQQQNQLTAEQEAEFKDAFTLFDKTGEGVVAVTELGLIMRKLGLSPSNAELEEMIEEIDPDGSVTYNGLNFEQFLMLATRKVSDVFSELEIQDAFRAFDREGNGFVSAAEMKQVLSQLGEKFNDEEMEAMLEACDVDVDGNIRYEEFVTRMMES